MKRRQKEGKVEEKGGKGRKEGRVEKERRKGER